MKSKIFIICLLGVLIFPLSVFAKTYSVIWNPEKVEEIIGLGGTKDLTVTLESSTSLKNVNLWIVPELQPFVSIEPTRFETIEANRPYQIRVHFSVPYDTQTGLYDGTIHLKVGSKTYPQTLKVELNIVGTTKTIGPEGGTIISSDGMVSIEITAGALSEDTLITISPTGEEGVVGRIYEFGPSGFSFLQPVIVTISYDPTSSPLNVKEEDLFIALIDEYIEILSDIQVNAVNHEISGKTTHFSECGIGEYQPTGVNISDFNKVATSFRMPIGNDGVIDLGDDLRLLDRSNWTNFNYPKISFNINGSTNKWYVATAFNQNRWLNNGWAEPSLDKSSLYSDMGWYHPGEDWNMFSEDLGKPIHAIADGIVLFSQSQQKRKFPTEEWVSTGFGNIIILGHKVSSRKIIASVYAHMKNLSPLEVRRAVIKGDEIGLIDTTGVSTAPPAPHLHFEITKDNSVLLKIDNDGNIKIPVFETELKKTGWCWPGTNTNFISDNYYEPSTFIETARIAGTWIGTPNPTYGYTETLNFYRDGTFVNTSDQGGRYSGTYSIITSGPRAYPFNPMLDFTVTYTNLQGGTFSELGDYGRGITISGNKMTLETDTGYDNLMWGEYTKQGEGVNAKIVFSSNRDGNHEIYMMNVDGTNQTRLTNNLASDGGPSYSPDGSKIVFISDRDGDLEIYVMNADGTNPIRLTNNSASDIDPSWSPDGTKVAFRTNRDGNEEIYVMNSNGTSQVNLTNNPSRDGGPKWSPDGNKIVFSSWRSGTAEIWVMNANGTNPIQLTRNTWSGSPCWSPDGSKIGYSHYPYGESPYGEIYVMNADGTNETRLTYTYAADYFGSWSPDGTKIVFQTVRDGNEEIYVMNSDGSNPINLTNNTADDQSPSWSPFP